MSDRVLIPLPGVGTLALSDEAYRAALAEGAKLGAAPAPPGAATGEPLLEAAELAAQFNIPVTWLEQKALEGVIPSLKFGRWRRFRRADVEAAVREKRDNGA